MGARIPADLSAVANDTYPNGQLAAAAVANWGARGETVDKAFTPTSGDQHGRPTSRSSSPSGLLSEPASKRGPMHKTTHLRWSALATAIGLLLLGWPITAVRARPAAAAISASASNVIAQPANGAAAQIRWTPSPATTPGWYLKTYDGATGYSGATWCWACTTTRVMNLVVGHTYTWSVYPMGTSSTSGPGPILGGAAVSNVITVSSDAVPAAPTGLSITAAPADETVTVAWQPATTGEAADSVLLQMWQMPGPSSIGTVTVPAFAGSKIIPVVPGQYAVLAYAQNSSGYSGAATAGWVTVANPCSGADVCVHVRTGTAQGAENLVAQGFLHSDLDWSGTPVDPTLTSALRPVQWRFSDQVHASAVQAYNPAQTQMISEHWYDDTAPTNGGHAITPWSDWTRFSSYVTNLVMSAEAGGWAPTYWDLFNEPENLTCGAACTWFSTADQATVTTANLLQMFSVEYQAVKAADPNAKVVAPSLTAYHDVPGEANDAIDMATFVQYAAANGIRPDAISWHESTDTSYLGDWGPSSFPFNIADHVARARQLLAANPGIGSPVILINEYGTMQTHTLPSWQTGMFSALERAGVAGANRSCWNDCWNPALDGLLAQTGSTWTGTLPQYWAAKAYADMSGGTRVATDSTSSWRLDGLSVRQDSSSTVRVLLGQHWGCDQPANGWCQNSYAVPALSTRVTIDWPYSSPAATVTVGLIPAGPSPISGPVVVSSARLVANGGKLSLTIPQAADGDAYSVVATASH